MLGFLPRQLWPRLDARLSGTRQLRHRSHRCRNPTPLQPLLIPILAAIPLHRNAHRIAHLNPCGVRTGAVGRIYWQSRSKNKRGTMFLKAVLHSACIIWCRPIAPPRAPIAKAEPEMAIIYGVSTLRPVAFRGG